MPPQRQTQLLAFLGSLGLAPKPGAGTNDWGLSTAALAVIDEALTHSSAGRRVNHEHLEFLGDAVLRLAASLFLQQDHPSFSVGRQAALRAQLVSDRWLAELGQRCNIEQVWVLGAMAAGDAAGRATVRAEISEALIGALYLAWGDPASGRGELSPVLQWLTPHWRSSVNAYLANPERDNWKSALQEWSQAQGLGLPHYRCQELSTRHGDPERFGCEVRAGDRCGIGRGPSRRAAEQAAAAAALAAIRQQSS
ncbi:MAG: ribonuclease III [Cyanobacteria bacterium K_DeepCast_35m_m2_023]|nr:ribonuclease III [Cyanobacteria bacterium K_DeepCast_35m_m2_023]